MAADHDVELTSEVLLLRPFRLEDAAPLCEAVHESMTELEQWLSWCHRGYTIANSIEFLQRRGEAFETEGEYGFVITQRGSERFLGAVGINQIDKAALRANLGYWLRSSATKCGYATQATRLVARWALHELHLERIEIVAAVGNYASQRVAERSGAAREGIARRRLRVHDVQHDAVVYSLVRADFAGL